MVHSKYLILHTNGLFSNEVNLSAQLDASIARKLDRSANLFTNKYFHRYWILKIGPTEALNRLDTEFGYKVITTGCLPQSADRSVYWTLRQGDT